MEPAHRRESWCTTSRRAGAGLPEAAARAQDRIIPQHLHSLFWDVDLTEFHPQLHPGYTILRVLEFGDQQAVAWLRRSFSEAQIREVIRGERRLSRKSADFWALVYGIPSNEVRALRSG